jgi:uncharacterized membrane protein YsdA (DUF1294 family)
MSGAVLLFLPPGPIYLWIWLGFMTCAGLVAMAADKVSAKLGSARISERDLALVALVGGFAGITLGGLLVHHKTSKGSFWPPILAAWVVWVIILALYLRELSHLIG